MDFKDIIKLIREEIERQDVKIENITKNDFSKIMNICDDVLVVPGFDRVCTNYSNDRMSSLTDFDKSIKLSIGNEIIGFYLFSTKETIEQFIKKYGSHVKWTVDEKILLKTKNKKGVQGIAVGILDKYKGKGYGKMLLEYPKTLGFDYIWGVQSEGLSNIEKWTKRREILAVGQQRFEREHFITVEFF